jgi:hypothetical protein
MAWVATASLKGDQGDQGTAGTAGVAGADGQTVSQVFVQSTDPETTNPNYTGPAIWYVTNASGQIISKRVRSGVSPSGPISSDWNGNIRNPLGTYPTRIEPFPQVMCHGGLTLPSGDLRMTFFTPSRNFTVKRIITIGVAGTNQAGATDCRLGIYRMNDLTPWPANVTLLARTAHKANRWGANGPDYANIVDDGAAVPNTISTVNLVKDQLYAVGLFSAGHTGTASVSYLATYRSTADYTYLPPLGWFGDTGYTSLPRVLTGGYAEAWSFPWFSLEQA